MNTGLFKRFGVVCLLSMLPIFSFATTVDSMPVAMLKQTSDRLLHALNQHDAEIRRNHDALYRIVQQVLVPRVDKEGMARLVVGRAYWNAATSAQKANFIEEFTHLVVRTYAVALTSYDQQQVRFFPLRQDIAGKQRLQVNTLVIKPGAPSIPVNYRLVKRGSEWKVYDFSVDGVSFVHNYRSQFAPVLSSQGFSGLLTQLISHNKGA